MVRIGIVDSHAIVRSGLRQLFSDYVNLRVVGEADNGLSAIDLVRSTEMDVLVMDLFMPGHSGLDALETILHKNPKLGVLVLTGYPEAHYAVNVLRQGARGYLNKECSPFEIVDAVRTIARGKNYLTPAVSELLLKQAQRKTEATALHEQLSGREFQVFLKLAQGHTTGEIADTLSLSAKTVSTYRARLLEKMNLQSNSDLTYYALKHGLIV